MTDTEHFISVVESVRFHNFWEILSLEDQTRYDQLKLQAELEEATASERSERIARDEFQAAKPNP